MISVGNDSSIIDSPVNPDMAKPGRLYFREGQPGGPIYIKTRGGAFLIFEEGHKIPDVKFLGSLTEYKLCECDSGYKVTLSLRNVD